MYRDSADNGYGNNNGDNNADDDKHSIEMIYNIIIYIPESILGSSCSQES